MYNEINDNSPLWAHPTHNATMIINKGSCSLTLAPSEIIEVVKCAGGNFKR